MDNDIPKDIIKKGEHHNTMIQWILSYEPNTGKGMRQNAERQKT